MLPSDTPLGRIEQLQSTGGAKAQLMAVCEWGHRHVTKAAGLYSVYAPGRLPKHARICEIGTLTTASYL